MRTQGLDRLEPARTRAPWLVAAVALVGCTSIAPQAGASAFAPRATEPAQQDLQLSLARQLALTGAISSSDSAVRRAELSDQEYYSFSGVGAIVCTVNGKLRTSTAFLVGAFDIGVTVAHTFEQDGAWAQPGNCVYTSTDSLGQVRERIPVSYVKAQWEAEVGAFGQAAKDLAVIRLSQPSRYAQRTMPLGKFSGAAAPVLMIGFRADLDKGAVKRKSRGTVYERRANGVAISSLAGFTHDMDSRGIAAGAPVIDERSGVIIGIHTDIGTGRGTAVSSRNTMITMNEWLESTLRGEMELAQHADAKVN